MTHEDPNLDLKATPDGLTVTLPPAGFKAARHEVRFALAFTGVLTALTAFFGWLTSGGAPMTFRVMAGAVLGLFWLIAIGLLVGAWRRARCMAIVDVVGPTLLINSSMPWSRQSIQIERDNIRALGVGPSGVVVDDVPVMALRIDVGKPVAVGGANQRALKLFRERDAAELLALAAALRGALGVERAEGRGWSEDAASSRAPERPAHLR